MEDWLSKFFERLTEHQKLVTVWVLIGVVVAQLAWNVISFMAARRTRLIIKDLKRQNQRLTEDRDQLQGRVNALNQVDDHVWKRPVATSTLPLAPKDKRRTRYLAICNLKGGVGKTTVTVNVGGALSQMGYRVLFVDLDFQGTLSNFLLKNELQRECRTRGFTSDALLKEDAVEQALRCAFPAEGLPNARVIIARDKLEIEEFVQQARFFVDAQKEARFRLREALHRPEIQEEFDVVLFDCPPRMSTACINALAASDYLLLPTSLSRLDVEAVGRTLEWLDALATVVPAELLAVLVTRVKLWRGKLTPFDSAQVNILKQRVEANLAGKGYIMTVKVPDSAEVYRKCAENIPIICTNSEAKKVFEQAARELITRMKL